MSIIYEQPYDQKGHAVEWHALKDIQINTNRQIDKEDKTKASFFDAEKTLIYYLTLGLFHNEQIINSQLKYLYKLLLDINFDESFDSLDENDHLYLGLTKSDSIMNCLINSYQTHELCIDIDGGRRLKLCN